MSKVSALFFISVLSSSLILTGCLATSSDKFPTPQESWDRNTSLSNPESSFEYFVTYGYAKEGALVRFKAFTAELAVRDNLTQQQVVESNLKKLVDRKGGDGNLDYSVVMRCKYLAENGLVDTSACKPIREKAISNIKDAIKQARMLNYYESPTFTTVFPEIKSRDFSKEIFKPAFDTIFSSKPFQPASLADILKAASEHGLGSEIKYARESLAKLGVVDSSVFFEIKSLPGFTDLDPLAALVAKERLPDFDYESAKSISQEVDSLLKTLVKDFKDPFSVKVRGAYFASEARGRVLCGELNGKNSYGAYVGFRSFYIGAGFDAIEDPDTGMDAQRYINACGLKRYSLEQLSKR